MSLLLEASELTAFYGKSQALFGVDLTLEEGQALALMGRNGMGKTTTIRALCRLTPAKAARLRFAGRDLTGLKPHQAARLGIGLAPEGRRCFSNLNVAEHLRVAARPGPWDARAVERLFPRLKERRAQNAATLSGGEQQMLAIGRALTTNPRLLILDEATEGLAPLIRHEIWAAIGAVKRESGLSLLLVDKSLKELATIADRATILARGAPVWSGAFSDLPANTAERWLGV